MRREVMVVSLNFLHQRSMQFLMSCITLCIRILLPIVSSSYLATVRVLLLLFFFSGMKRF